MDKEFQLNADTFFSERHSSITAKIRKENERSATLLQTIASEKEKIKTNLSDEVMQQFDSLMDLIHLYNNTESKYLYVQGYKDCIDLSHFMDTDLINADFDEIILTENGVNGEKEGVVYYEHGNRKRNNENGSAIRLD